MLIQNLLCRVGLVEVLLGILDWRAGGRNGLCAQMKWNENEASVGRVLAVEVILKFCHSRRCNTSTQMPIYWLVWMLCE